MEQHNPRQQGLDEVNVRPRWRLRRIFLMITLGTIALCMILTVGAGITAYSYIKKIEENTPSVEAMLAARTAQPSILLSANGTHLATFSRRQQEQVGLSEISPHAIDALIATEDHRFYEHSGIDMRRTLSAVYHTMVRGDAQGGSTITQQLVRNLFPEAIGRERTLERKLREMITALKIEKAYTKEQILETYLNSVPFLYNVVGIEMAARTYYDKSAAALDVLESATLIGMLKGTSYYNPVINPERAQQRRNVVLGQMVKQGMLSDAAYLSLREQPLNVTLHRQPNPLGGIAPHFAAHVRRQLIEWADANDYNLYTDGLTIHSTLDDDLQAAAVEAVESQSQVLQNIADVEWAKSTKRVASHTPGDYAALRKKVEPFRHFWDEKPDLLDTFVRETPAFKTAVSAGLSEQAALAKLKGDADFMARVREYKTRLEAGFLAMDPGTGEVKAWVGSRNFDLDQFDHVAQAERQPGSTFKPIVYGAALEYGFPPERVYPDGEVEIRTAEGTIWRPTDMSGFSGRMMSMREGLIKSKNTITAQVMQDVGVPNIIGLARAVGIRQSRLDPVPSLSLGTSPVTLLEMVSAYSTIARAGEYRQPLMIKRIEDRNGNLLVEFNPTPEHAMSEETALELIDMMRGVIRQGTGTEVRRRFNISADIAGKTGTTQNNTDGWFILMHPHLIAGAWVGFNDQRVTMRSDYWGQGGHNAVLLVGDFFRDTLKAKLIDTKATFPKPYRPPPLIVESAPDEWANHAAGEDPMVVFPSGYGVITRSNGEEVIISPSAGNEWGVETVERRNATPRSISTDELGRILNGIGSAPAPDEQSDSSGVSVYSGSADYGTNKYMLPEN